MYVACDECFQVCSIAIRLRYGCGMLADSVLMSGSALLLDRLSNVRSKVSSST